MWIKVDENDPTTLPATKTLVLIAVSCNHKPNYEAMVTPFYLSYKVWYDWFDRPLPAWMKVSHWQPYPKDPE
jgi:hypothetical protein